MSDSRRRPSPAQILASAILVASVLYFAARTTPRHGHWMWDYGVMTEASRAWLDGRNPYDEAALYARWRAQPVKGWLDQIDHVESLLPPPTLMVMSPLALLPRAVGMVAWYALQWALLVAIIPPLISLAGLKPVNAAAMYFAALVFLLGPVQSGVQAGQPVVPAVACIVFAFWLDLRDRPIAAGCLLALAMALKLQLAAPFVVYFALRGRWKTAITSSWVFVTLAALSVAWLLLRDVSFEQQWLANLRRSTGPGGPNDFAAGVAMDHLLNLQLPLYAITSSRTFATIAALALVSIAAIVYALKVRRAMKEPAADPLLLVAPVAVLTLLPVYHRYYDATLLVIPLAWAIAALATPARKYAIATLALTAPFAFPVGWATNLINRGYLPASVADQPWWRILVMPLQVWLLTALAVVLIAAIARRR